MIERPPTSKVFAKPASRMPILGQLLASFLSKSKTRVLAEIQVTTGEGKETVRVEACSCQLSVDDVLRSSEP